MESPLAHSPAQWRVQKAETLHEGKMEPPPVSFLRWLELRDLSKRMFGRSALVLPQFLLGEVREAVALVLRPKGQRLNP